LVIDVIFVALLYICKKFKLADKQIWLQKINMYTKIATIIFRETFGIIANDH